MKKKLLITIVLLLFTRLCFSAPTNSMSQQYTPSPNATIASSSYNSEENHQVTTFNAHSHTDITQVGTITSGTWQGGAIGTTYGGTGSDFSATAQGNIFYFSGAGTISTLSPGTANQILKTGGAGANPSWTTDFTGTLDGYDTSTTAGASKIYVSGAGNYLPAATVDTNALKTTTGEVSRSTAGYLTLAGGTYAFFPQTKTTAGTSCVTTLNGSHTGATDPGSTYGTFIYVYDFGGGGSYFAQTRYVTSSGTDWFVFLLVDKISKEIVALYSSADHPSYGNGGDYNKIPHPFGNVDLNKYEIALLDKDTIKSIKEESKEVDEQTGEKLLVTLIMDNYKVDMSKEEVYKPLHSGKFIGKEPVLVQNLPDYIKVRKLTKMTAQEKADKKARQEQKALDIKQAKEAKENKIKQKLGLNDNELLELKDILK